MLDVCLCLNCIPNHNIVKLCQFHPVYVQCSLVERTFACDENIKVDVMFATFCASHLVYRCAIRHCPRPSRLKDAVGSVRPLKRDSHDHGRWTRALRTGGRYTVVHCSTRAHGREQARVHFWGPETGRSQVSKSIVVQCFSAPVLHNAVQHG